MSDEPAQPTTVRVAAIDMGSNTTRLLVADVTRHADGTLTHVPVVRRTTITRLAEQVDARGILLPQAIARVRNALTSYNRELRALGAVFALATATSAVRDADNGEAFLGEVEHSYAFRAELLSGDEEAQATWAGVTSDAVLSQRARAGLGLLVDIGGGSTEIVLTRNGALVDHHSFQMGSVRVTERDLASAGDPPPHDALVRARAHAREQLRERFPDAEAVDVAIGVAGTVTTVVAVRDELAPYDPARVHGAELTTGDVHEVRDRLAALPISERATVPGIEPQRAPVILGGLCIIEAVLDHFAVSSLIVSEADILDGVVLRAGQIALDEGIEELPEPFGRTMC